VTEVPRLGQTAAAVGGHLACCKRKADKGPGGTGGPATGFQWRNLEPRINHGFVIVAFKHIPQMFMDCICLAP
jgi:hypothetical protein